MSAPDKRRVHGVTGNHVLRTASSSRHAHHGPSGSAGAGSAGSASGSTSAQAAGSGAGSHLPAVPQRVAVVNASAVTDATHDAAAAAAEKDKDKEKEKDGAGISNSSASTVTRTSSSSRTVKDSRQRDRDRDRDRESASLAAQVRQKDERIAYLEREMDTMEREFQHQLDKLSANESETATFWQAKHSALHQQYLRTDTELRLLRAEVDVREAEREELRQGWEVLRRELAERDDEVRGLRGQVRGLKEFVSTSTRADGQTSDEVFGDGMARLGNGLQNWVISHFRKAKIDEETTAEINELVPMYEELARTAKVHLLQSVVSRILVDMIFDAYFVGLSPAQAGLFRQMEELLASMCGPAAQEPVNQWRASTLTLLRREAAPRLLQDDTAAFAETVVARTNRVLHRLTGGSGSGGGGDAATASGGTGTGSNTSSEGARDAALRVLVNNSIELARLLVVQKAVLRVHMPQVLPHQRVLFDPSTMEDVGGAEDDEDGLADREIACVVFPGVVKRGDEHGAQMQYRNVICKAKVVCR
ncbi:hypothetical protein IF1G_05306 [Cordyceps javanica]|uniref:Involucrin repeat protein n=1 Tax=Cordyceps javanica TaxID=43265 RepID=A0A545V1A7_9HYPO|nr:hypothetical protein IF1G_05306 [Cordyceps javanica]